MSQNDKTFVINSTNESSDIDELYKELGKAYYEGGFEDPLPQLLPLFDRITTKKNEMSIQPTRCPKCGTIIKKDAVFCGECGYKLK